MMLLFRKRSRSIVTFLLFLFLQTYTAEVYALTSGPAQEEYASFEPIGTTDMVNLYTGSFTYNIPLLSVPGPNGGYPINLAYHSGIGMDQEASWVGLGWNVNVGAVNRSLRGLPDDFNGDKVKYQRHMRPNTTTSVNVFENETESVGVKADSDYKVGSSQTIQVYYNNYKGLGYRVSFSPKLTSPAVQGGINLSYDPNEGIGIGASFNVSTAFKKGVNGSLGVSGQYNSRQGLQNIAITGSINPVYTELVDKGWHAPLMAGETMKEKENFSFARSTGGVSFNFSQGVPATTMAMVNTNISTNLQLGFTPGTGDDGTFQSIGSFQSEFPLKYTSDFSVSNVEKNGEERDVRSYGYLHSKEAKNDVTALTDFNHTPFNYSREIPFVPPSTVTNDVFGVTGQGISSVFKAYHSDLGQFSPTKVVSRTKQYRISIDVGVTSGGLNTTSCNINYQFGFGGIPFNIGTATSSTGKWESEYALLNPFDFESTQSGAIKFQPTFFKDMGDRPAMLETDTKYDVWKEDKAVRIDIGKVEGGGVKMTSFSTSDNSSVSNPTNYSESLKNTRRTRVIQSLTHEERVAYGTTNDYYDSDGVLVSGKGGSYEVGKKDHIAEVSILEPDGMRYTYGLPAYNIEQEDATFSVAKTGDEVPSSITSMPAGGYDKAFGEWSKKPEFLDKKKLPSYAHSWMLTSVVSADYVDRTGNGVSSDDLGYWVDFKYQKTSDAYHWRAPYEGAIYMPGTGQDYDDKGSYSKGEKELFYLKEIRTKTHIAVFELEEREDALGASTDANGGKPASISSKDRMQALSKIKLYTIEEYEQENPVPLKTTNFGYETDKNKQLCKGVPNHATDGGKLTLRKVWFTYQNSTRGSSSPYVFHYGVNKPYALKNNDCWGNYKDNNGGNYPYHQFPYTTQPITNKYNTFIDIDNDYAVAWNLEQIDLPTGSSMHIEYEQNDYAYVEDKKSMQLYEISYLGKGFSGISGGLRSRRSSSAAADVEGRSLKNVDQYYDGDLISPDFSYRIYFPLKNAIPDAADPMYSEYGHNMYGVANWFKEHYIGETKQLYFKAATNLLEHKETNRNNKEVDFVSGYGDLRVNTPVADYGVARSSDGSTTVGGGAFDIGYVTLYAVPFQAFGVAKDHLHPIRDAAFQHLRSNRADLVHGTNTTSAVAGLFSALPDLISMMAGYKYYYKIQNWCHEIYLDGFSQIRLQVPDGKKKGGGVRVKEIKIKDNWEAMTGGTNSDYQNAEYGQIYDYTIEEEGRKISSGVAYEPFVGKEQNPMVVANNYKEANTLQQPNNLFMELPVMMAHYPSASIGYRKVTVRSLTARGLENIAEKRMTTPITEYEFYSPKEFPIIFDKTKMDKVGPHYRVIPIPGIYTEFRRYEGVSQGYSLTFNDMPGKPKSITQKTYPNSEKDYDEVVISKQEYEYFTDDYGNIVSEVDVFTEDGKYEKARLGVEVDVQVETNENKESSDNFTLDINLVSGIIVIPQAAGACVPFPMLASGGVSSTSSSLKTAVVQKFIHKKGILKSTTITTQNSTIKTENLVFDALTSEPLLTRTTNEFNDPIYSYTQKAHWKYDGMAAAFKNVGITVEGNINRVTSGANTDLYSVNEASFPFIEGDEIYVESQDVLGAITNFKATIYTVSKASPNATNGYIGVAKMDGTIVDIPSLEKITIIRSGRKNMLYAPAGGITAKKINYASNTNLGDETTLTFDETNEILNASAVRYRDFWPNAKNCYEIDICEGTICVEPHRFDCLDGVPNQEQVLIQKLNSGDIEIRIDGQPISASTVTTNGLCRSTKDICVSTVRDYDVIVYDGENWINYTTTLPESITPNGTCDQKGEDVFIDCASVQNLSVDGCLWPSNLTVQGASCDLVKGYFEADHPNFSPERPHQQYPCMSSAVDVFPVSIWPGWTQLPSPSIVGYNFLWSNAPAPFSSNTGWYFPNYPWNNLSDIASDLTLQTGTTWFLAPNSDELCSFMTLQEAQLMDGTVKLGLRHHPLPAPLIVSLNLGGCHPFYDSNVNDDYSQIWYDFKFEVETQHEYTLLNVPQGTHVINNRTVNIDPIKTFQVEAITVTLPANKEGAIYIVERACNGNPPRAVVMEPFNTKGDAIKVSFPLKGTGSHSGEIFETGTPHHKQHFDIKCLASNVIATEVPVCDGNNVTSIPSSNANYYRNGTKGNWRPWTSFTYVTERNQNKASIRDKGTFTEFTPFDWVGTNERTWQRSGLATKYSGDGYELESIDALGIYSAALYDYNDNLPVAVAQNARYNELLFDGFENYPKGCNAHWDIGGAVNVVNGQSHTGRSSYQIAQNDDTFFEPISLAGINEVACADALEKEGYNRLDVLDFLKEGIEEPYPSMNIPEIMRTTTRGSNNDFVKPLPLICNCLGKFAPKANKKYTFSAWVKRDYDVYSMVNYQNLTLSIRFKDASGNTIGADTHLSPKGSMIEHWQRISGDITIPIDAESMEIYVANSGPITYLDDLRVQPFKSSMQTYVYDKATLRNTATLDDNNFATFYIYDERGQLEKTKKETTEGIKTINEGRQYISGNN